jgi:hypothetical protein
MRPRRLGLRQRLRVGVGDDEIAAFKALAIMLLTALPPAPPTPNTVMRGLRSAMLGHGRLSVIALSACCLLSGSRRKTTLVFFGLLPL